MKKLTIGIVQAGPVQQNKTESLNRLKQYVSDAAEQEVKLLVFGETWFSGYPAWFDHCPGAALWNTEAGKAVYRRMYDNSLCVPGPETEQISALAQQHEMIIAIGVNEKVENGSHQGSLFNTLLIFGPTGKLETHHRKLVPTYTERLVHAPGDGHGLTSFESPYGKIGGLICWEHWMPLARQAMHNQGEHLHLALWPWVHEDHQLASKHYALEGRCFVISVGQIMRAKELPQEFESTHDPEALLLRGGSCIIGPDGKFLLEPVLDQEALLVYTIEDTGIVIGERMNLDTSGHYQRSDIFKLEIDRKRNHK